MAKGGNTWQRKLIDKDKRRVLRERFGTMTPLLGRSKSTHAEKAIALEHQKRLINGHREGHYVNKGGVILVPIFEGTGLPDETIKPPKDRVWRDLKAGEKRDGFMVRGFGKKIAARAAKGYNAVA